MRIKNSFRLIAYLLSAVVLINSSYITAHAAKSDELQKEKEEIERQKKEAEKEKNQTQSQLDAINKEASAISGEMSDIQDEIDEVDSAIVETLAAIEMLTDEISDLEAIIAVTNDRYLEAKAEEEKQYASMKLRIRYMYEKGNTSYMQLLIESQGFSDMVNKAEYIEKLYDYDRKLLLRYIEAKEQTLAYKEQLEDEKSELDGSLYEMDEEKEYLDSILAEKEAEYGDYAAQLAAAQKEASVFKAKVNNQNNAIKSLEKLASSKQDEINKAKAQEEEERRAAEEAARAAQRAESSSDGSSSSSNKSYSSASSFSGTTGAKMVAYAKQFIGNPYVYGGTSLTEGCDCSGFVWRIYKDFGYSIPRLGMRSIGSEVSYENAQPGDIVCYAGHVALYAGDGMVVHASTARTGIKMSRIGYKQWITIRRVI